MTPEELSAARTLLAMRQELFAAAQEMAPHGDGRPAPYGSAASVARKMMAMALSAADAFLELTGKGPFEVELWELNAENPSAWTRSARRARTRT